MPPLKRRSFRLILVPLGLSVLAAACSGGGESTGPKVIPVATVAFVAPPTTLEIGTSISLSAQAKDAAGAVLAGKTFTYASSANAIATVTLEGTVTAVAVGMASITVTSEGKSATVTITVTPVPVAGVNVTLSANQVTVGETAQAAAVVVDAAGRTLTGRTVTWASSQPTIASVNPQTGLVTGVAAGGPVAILAMSEGVSGGAQLFVSAPVSCSGTLQLAVGEIRTLSGSDRTSLCFGGASASEYVLIPFNSSTVASSIATLQLTPTNTSAPTGNASASRQAGTNPILPLGNAIDDRSIELQFRIRERRDLTPVLAARRRSLRANGTGVAASQITGIPANPSVGEVYAVNVNFTGNTCTSAKVLHDARVAAVLPRVLVLIDVQSPANGYTDAELAGFGQTFDAIGYSVDVENFGAPTDIDTNGRIAILFTPSVNAIPGPPGGVVGGLQTARDLFPLTDCIASNEGEIFYLPVPDSASTINGNYTNKASLAGRVQPVLAHEFQHLINAGRRIYITDATAFEEVWLNEGLSHIAEELAYYRVSGNAPLTNIDLPKVQSTPEQLAAINSYQVSNLGRLRTYMLAPETNSPIAQNDILETRGAIWQLLRYAADRKGGSQQTTWFSLVNSSQSGQANLAGVFGSVVPLVRDWAVTQYVDDTGIPVPATYSHPSWNFRSLLPALNSGAGFPLLTRILTNAPIDLSLAGGGAGYVRFRVSAGVNASIGANSSGAPPIASIDLILVRTQ